jgi:hypothetical protein
MEKAAPSGVGRLSPAGRRPQRQQTPALPLILSHVSQRLGWLHVHLVLAGGSIPVSLTLRIHSLFLSFPSSQVLENARRQSVEGLALPFLFNWLLGMNDKPPCIVERSQ